MIEIITTEIMDPECLKNLERFVGLNPFGAADAGKWTPKGPAGKTGLKAGAFKKSEIIIRNFFEE